MSRRPHLHLQNVTLFVRDQDESLRFYVDKLGFRLVVDANVDDLGRWVAVAPPDGTAIFALIAPEPGTPDYSLIGRSRGIALLSDDVPAVYEAWSERGVRFHHPPLLQTWKGMLTTLEDPDGNILAIIGFDDVTRRLEAEQREAAEKLEAEHRAAQELEIARKVQARLFPQTLPPIRTLDYAGLCIQARQVGGDYYDFLDLGGDRLGLVVGDISGKGIAAALLMAHLQANLRSQCAIASDDPRRFLQSVNRLFRENTPESSYATVFFAEYDDASRRLRYASCGHLAALLLRGDGTLERLESTGTALGLFEQWECAISERQLFPGDTLAIYSDGVTESFDDLGGEFGEDRVVQAMRRHRGGPAKNTLAAIVEDVRAFNSGDQHDDITLIVATSLG